jgi:hypothetical protein
MRARIPSVRPRTSRPRSEASGEECLWGTKTLLRDAATASYSWITAGASRLRISGTLRGSAREGAVRIGDL